MGLYSDVILVIKKDFAKIVKEKASESVMELFGYADKRIVGQDAIRYEWNSIKWYNEEPGFEAYSLHNLLEELDEPGQEYQIYKLTSEFMYDEFSPLDSWGYYSDPELEPEIELQFTSMHLPLNEAYDAEETLILKDYQDRISGTLEIDISEMFQTNKETFERTLAQRLSILELEDIQYEVVSSNQSKLIFAVNAKVSGL